MSNSPLKSTRTRCPGGATPKTGARGHAVMRWFQLRFDFDSNSIRFLFGCDSAALRLPFDCDSTALRPFDDLRYDRRPHLSNCCRMGVESKSNSSCTTIDVKKRFFTFFIQGTFFTFFNVFYFANVFYF